MGEEPHSIMRSEEVMVIASSIKKPLSPRLESEDKLATILPASFRVVARMNTGVTFLPSSLLSSTTLTVQFPDLVMLACNSLLHADVLDKNSADCRRVLEGHRLCLRCCLRWCCPHGLILQAGHFNTFGPSMSFSPTRTRF